MLLRDLAPAYISSPCACVVISQNTHSHMDYRRATLLMTQVSGHIISPCVYTLAWQRRHTAYLPPRLGCAAAWTPAHPRAALLHRQSKCQRRRGAKESLVWEGFDTAVSSFVARATLHSPPLTTLAPVWHDSPRGSGDRVIPPSSFPSSPLIKLWTHDPVFQRHISKLLDSIGKPKWISCID